VKLPPAFSFSLEMPKTFTQVKTFPLFGKINSSIQIYTCRLRYFCNKESTKNNYEFSHHLFKGSSSASEAAARPLVACYRRHARKATQGLILQPDVNLRLNVLGLIDNDFVLFHTILILTAKSTTNYSIKQKRQ